MILKFVEAGGNGNWGKFAVGRYTDEQWRQQSTVDRQPLLAGRGWDRRLHAWVLDLQTGEGATFRLGGHASADLTKHRIWVCPLFEPFLTWLYVHVNDTPDWWDQLPQYVNLPFVPLALYGHRRPGPAEDG